MSSFRKNSLWQLLQSVSSTGTDLLVLLVFSASLPALERECPAFHRLLHRYSQFVFETVSQSAACNRLHVIEQRCARWLLMSEDRVGRNKFDLTQEFLAEMLGVRRTSVTEVASKVQSAGAITYSRGVIKILDRPALMRMSCECYQTLVDQSAALA